ncbi:MAG: 4-hydroxythreonine-4-phosphate dehydrogenase PdxA [Gammaproteobacteria bacterium]|nr:4-hydroxythreonine-4-phosphate dehydrogenase PdxA [Gammaproteobacteria bacterium]
MSEDPAAPVVAVTPGEPAGIGPDIVLALAAEKLPARLVAIAAKDMLAERAAGLGLDIELIDCPEDGPAPGHRPGTLQVLDIAMPRHVEPGRPSPDNARYLLETLRIATEGCLSGRFAALVTGPLNKAVINEAGIPFTGHTEYLAELTDTPQVVMMLATEGLRVPLVTTHLPLRAVADAITPAWLERCIRITVAELRRRYGIACPRILVCGLNPHAGEDGHMGREDEDVVKPVIAKLVAEGMALEGPFPADTVFTPPYMRRADAVLAMYHDQGLPVLKHLGFGKAVNVTLGLPIIRTSVDHGTAFDLAGTGRAETGSLRVAIEEAVKMAAHSGARRA